MSDILPVANNKFTWSVTYRRGFEQCNPLFHPVAIVIDGRHGMLPFGPKQKFWNLEKFYVFSQTHPLQVSIFKLIGP